MPDAAVATNVIDNDTLEAVQTLWATVQGLPAIVSRRPGAGRLKSTKEEPLALPYAQIVSEHDSTERGYNHRIDRRKVSINIYGTKAQVVTAMNLALATFNDRLGWPGGTRLEYPSGARFLSWLLLTHGTLSQDDTVRAGEDVWVGMIEARVSSVRSAA